MVFSPCGSPSEIDLFISLQNLRARIVLNRLGEPVFSCQNERVQHVLPALDGFLDILRKDKHYKQDQVKDVFVGLLALIGDSHPEARQYRKDLSAALF